ncbi:MAG: cytidylate kinase family protein [Candidatus Woesearchaeota archaeon]
MKITISGTAGSGKSTLAKMLAEKLNYKYYSMGYIQRQVAKKKNVSIEELAELEKTDPSIDIMIDETQKKLNKKNNFVLDSWLGFYFLPDAFKIFITADIKTRAKRILNREPENYKNLKDAIKKIKQREKANRERWLKLYKIDFLKEKNYDLFLDTTNINQEEALNIVYKKIKKFIKK